MFFSRAKWQRARPLMVLALLPYLLMCLFSEGLHTHSLGSDSAPLHVEAPSHAHASFTCPACHWAAQSLAILPPVAALPVVAISCRHHCPALQSQPRSVVYSPTTRGPPV